MDEALIRLQEEELQRTGRYYKHICFLCVPLLCVSCYLYGLRPLLLCGFAVLMGNLCDRLISLLRRRVYQAGDYSNESFALVITLLMPATVDWERQQMFKHLSLLVFWCSKSFHMFPFFCASSF